MKFLTLLLLISTAYADLTVTVYDQMKLPTSELMIVTHAGSFWDWSSVAKPELNRRIPEIEQLGIPRVYLVASPLAQGEYYFQDERYTYLAHSVGGELGFQFEARHVIMAGGYYHACFKQTFEDILKSFKKRPGDATITILADAVYTSNDDHVPRELKMTLGDHIRQERRPAQGQLALLKKFLPGAYEIFLNGKRLTRKTLPGDKITVNVITRASKLSM